MWEAPAMTNEHLTASIESPTAAQTGGRDVAVDHVPLVTGWDAGRRGVELKRRSALCMALEPRKGSWFLTIRLPAQPDIQRQDRAAAERRAPFGRTMDARHRAAACRFPECAVFRSASGGFLTFRFAVRCHDHLISNVCSGVALSWYPFNPSAWAPTATHGAAGHCLGG